MADNETKPVSSRHYSRVIDTLRIEAEAITAASARLSAVEVEKAIELLRSADGKVIVTGIGKSGVIAEKIAQTLTSTGTPAVFVHPSDAIHGGLGIMTAGDVVVALSNSGETDEVLVILPYIKQRGSGLIAIVGN